MVSDPEKWLKELGYADTGEGNANWRVMRKLNKEVSAEPPYAFCWECGRKLARVTVGKRRGQLAYRVVRVADFDAYVHAECESAAKRSAEIMTEED